MNSAITKAEWVLKPTAIGNYRKSYFEVLYIELDKCKLDGSLTELLLPIAAIHPINRMAYKKLKYWFDEELAEMLAARIFLVFPDFNKRSFTKSIKQQVERLELKDRVEVIADELAHHMTHNYRSDVAILWQILGPENKEETGMFTNFYWIMPIAKYVEKYGLVDFDTSIKMIEEITKRNTGEYTVRPFIETYPDRTLAVMKKWSESPNSHVRRLSSEGCRPRLPWAKKLDRFITDPQPIIPILDNLKDDQSRYVQKSVANAINDILKDNRETGKQLIETWNQGPISSERKWIIKHSLRNLLKEENGWAKKMIL